MPGAGAGVGQVTGEGIDTRSQAVGEAVAVY